MKQAELSSAKEYEDQGYFILRNFFNSQEIAHLTALIDPIFLQWRDGKEAHIFEHKLLNMHSLTHAGYFEQSQTRRLALFNAILPTKLTQYLDALFGEGLYFHNTQLFFNPINKARLPYWHRDMQYSPIADELQASELLNMLSLHVRIPLLDETGVELIPGSHKRWDTELERKVRFELDEHENSETLADSKLIELSQGDLLIFNAQMLHRGNYALNHERKALDLCIGKPHPLSIEFLDKSVLPTSQELTQLDNPSWFQAAYQLGKA